MRLTFLYTLALALLSTGLLTGCGVKPDKVGPPPGVEDDVFPRTYPAPEEPGKG